MAQQTALQFFLMGLVDLEIGKGISTDKQVELHKLFEQAKQMEANQSDRDYNQGFSNGYSEGYDKGMSDYNKF